MTSNNNSRNQRGFISTWPALGALIAGLILTCSATYLITQHQQNMAYSRFIAEAQDLRQQVVPALADTTHHLTLLAVLAEQPGQALELVKRQAGPVKNLAIYKTQGTEVIPLPLPEWLEGLGESKVSPPVPESLQLELLEVVAAGQPQLSSPHMPADQIKANRAEAAWLYPRGNIVYSFTLDLHQLLAPLNSRVAQSGMRLQLYDLQRFSNDPFLTLGTVSASTNTDVSPEPVWEFKDVLKLYRHEWLIKVTPETGFLSRFDSQFALVTFVGGILISLLLASLVSLKTRQPGPDKNEP